MATLHVRFCVVRLTILTITVLIQKIVTTRHVCLKDAILFHGGDTACGFKKTDFAKVFKDNPKECQIDCSFDSQPSYEDMKGTHELTKMMIHFVNKTNAETSVINKWCPGQFLPTNVMINITCKRPEVQNDRCVDDKHCANKTANSLCNKISGLCHCAGGHLYLWEMNTCAPVRGLGEQCKDYIQCNAKIQNSMCNGNNECRCQPGYIEVNNSCVSERKLNESCHIPIQCSKATPNSTCDNKTGVCECIEGHIKIANTCLSVQILLKEIYKNYESCSHSTGGCKQNKMKTVCINNTDTQLRQQQKDLLYESEQNDNSGLVIGVGTACFILGAVIGGLVYFIITRNRRKTKLRSKIPSNDATEQLSVQVSQHMNSRQDYNDDIRDNEEGNDVYIHLHQDPFEVDVQSDYDHAPQQMTAEDDYSHMNTCNKTLVQEPDDYGELN